MARVALPCVRPITPAPPETPAADRIAWRASLTEARAGAPARPDARMQGNGRPHSKPRGRDQCRDQCRDQGP